MNRRIFTPLAALLLACCSTVHAGLPPGGADNTQDLADTIKETNRFTAQSGEGALRLEVELYCPTPDEVKQETSRQGDIIAYYYKGTRLPESYWPGRNIVTRFDLYWDGRQIAIPRKYWEDVCHLRVQTVQRPEVPLTFDEAEAFEKFAATLDQPRLYLSADGETALIEWSRPEDCDNHSTIRWLIGKDGTVMRHTLTPPAED